MINTIMTQTSAVVSYTKLIEMVNTVSQTSDVLPSTKSIELLNTATQTCKLLPIEVKTDSMDIITENETVNRFNSLETEIKQLKFTITMLVTRMNDLNVQILLAQLEPKKPIEPKEIVREIETVNTVTQTNDVSPSTKLFKFSENVNTVTQTNDESPSMKLFKFSKINKIRKKVIIPDNPEEYAEFIRKYPIPTDIEKFITELKSMSEN